MTEQGPERVLTRMQTKAFARFVQQLGERTGISGPDLSRFTVVGDAQGDGDLLCKTCGWFDTGLVGTPTLADLVNAASNHICS